MHVLLMFVLKNWITRPFPYRSRYLLQLRLYNEVEKLVHKNIDRLSDLRIRQNREFFNVAPQVALDIFYDIANLIDDAEVTVYKDNKPLLFDVDNSVNSVTSKANRRGRFKFSMINVKIGEYVTFIPTNLVVKVASDDSIEYDGRIYKLSPFVGTFMPEEFRNVSGAYQGAKYFSYKGIPLDKLRKSIELESESAIEE